MLFLRTIFTKNMKAEIMPIPNQLVRIKDIHIPLI